MGWGLQGSPPGDSAPETGVLGGAANGAGDRELKLPAPAAAAPPAVVEERGVGVRGVSGLKGIAAAAPQPRTATGVVGVEMEMSAAVKEEDVLMVKTGKAVDAWMVRAGGLLLLTTACDVSAGKEEGGEEGEGEEKY
mmetsp:Transcript_42351/g.83119  ORF Transcript_42351/g.83119 Transcript_42351/m.83119 type:complete len:137 (+) Transcript_42351:1824-2234(+)